MSAAPTRGVRAVYVSRSELASSIAPVHAGSQSDPRGQIRHERFIREKLILTGLVLAALPLGLAFGGVPSLTEAVFFALALMPLAASLLVARSGHLVVAEGFAIGGEVAIGILLSAVAGAAAGYAWLVLAVIQTMVVAPLRSLRVVASILGAAALAMMVLDGRAMGPRAAEASTIAGFCAALAAALAAWRLRDAAEPNDTATRIAQVREDALLAVTRDAVAVFDKAGSLVADVAGCAALLGGRGELMHGRGFFDHVNVADRPLFLKLLGDAAHGTETKAGVLRLHLPADDLKTGAAAAPRTVVAEIRARAAGTEILALLRDTTADQRRDDEIVAARRSIDAALLAKNDFLANMSHELRTPLNAIIGFSEILGSRTMSPSDPTKQREYAGIIHQSGQHLLGTVNAILDMSKLQAGSFALLPEPFAMQPLAEQCCDAVRLQAQTGRVEIVHDIPAKLEQLVGDRRVCRQILINLLTNAVKFTPPQGRVTLRVRPDGTALQVRVIDTGIGIGEADLARLGDPFFQAGTSLNRPYEGAGLGLSVVRGLVGLHGGSIAIESALGAGTTVTLRLPLDCRTAKTSAAAIIETVPRRGLGDPVRFFEPRAGGPRSTPDTRMKQSA